MSGSMTIKRRRETGVAMIEMVIVTPLLLLLVLGVSELGNAFMQQNTLNKSVRDAARQVAGLALLGTTGTALLTPDLQVDARNLVVYGNVDGVGSPRLPALSVGQVSVSVSDAVNNLVTVQANYAYIPIVSPVLETFGMGTGPSLEITLRAAATMRAL
jgi:Flp pilus assembly protein TadG